MPYTNLPGAYLERMQGILKDEYPAFIESYNRKPEKGLRFNTSKARQETIEKLVREWNLERVPWCGDGYYYPDGIRPGLSPYHAAGVFYLQEPSAMLPASLAELSGREMVLDLCAAPGGKSAQLAVNSFLLISNEPVLGRARTLSSNIERMGFENVIVTSAYPESFSAFFCGYFDLVMADAPCSGEGMFRKDSGAITQWSPGIVESCIVRQKEILDNAARMLKGGGKLIYSTCTFEMGENEGQVMDFLAGHEDFRLVSERRIYPHRDRGEGHYCAVLKKDHPSLEACAVLAESEVRINDLSSLLKKNGIHVLRTGVEKGRCIESRKKESIYEPSHAEALSNKYESDEDGRVNLLSDDLCARYLRGESLYLKLPENAGGYETDADHGFVTVYYDRYSLGNGKLVNGMLKNLYPKGLRFLS